MKFIKQFGHQRSGSNLIKALIEINFDEVVVLSDALGLKHDEASWESMRLSRANSKPASFGIDREVWGQLKDALETGNLGFVINTKEPLSWLVSYHRYSEVKTRNLDPFGRIEFGEDFFRYALELWSRALASWVDLNRSCPDHVVWIPYDAYLKDPRSYLELIRDRFGLEQKTDELVCRDSRVTRMGIDTQKGEEVFIESKRFDPSYYQQARWRDAYTPDHWDMVREILGVLASKDERIREGLDLVGYDPYPNTVKKQVVRAGPCNSSLGQRLVEREFCLLSCRNKSSASVEGVWVKCSGDSETCAADLAFQTRCKGKMDGYQVRVMLSQPITCSGFSASVLLQGWKSLRYLALGFFAGDGKFYHIKIPHFVQGEVLDESCAFSDLIWKIQNPEVHWTAIEISELRVFVSGEPDEAGGIIAVRDAGLFTLSGDGFHSLPVSWHVTEREAGFSSVMIQYFRRCFRSAEEQTRYYFEGASIPFAGDRNLCWECAESIPSEVESSPTYRYSWHAAHPAAILLAGSDAIYYHKAFNAARDWVNLWLERSFFAGDPDQKYVWYDHGVAERQMLFLVLWIELDLRNDQDPRFMKRLFRAIHSQAVLLASEAFYCSHQRTRYHNHAWFQDIALLATAQAFPCLPMSGWWRTRALNRLQDQISKLMIMDGDYTVFIENSIGYHHGIERLLTFASNVAKGLESDAAKSLREASVSLERFSDLMKYPDGRSSSFGDTFRIPNGVKRKPKSKSQMPIFALLPKAGYAVVRGNHEGIPWVFTMVASSLCKTHKHEDHLSFSLYFDGIEWLIDPSFYSHEYDKDIPAYLRSAAAHNAICLKDVSYSIEPGIASIEGEMGEGDFWSIEGSHHAYAGLRCDRQVKGYLDRLNLSFEDGLSSDNGTNRAGILRLQAGEGVVIRREGNQEFSMRHPASGKTIRLSFEHDQNDSNTIGEISPGFTGLGFMKTEATETLSISVAGGEPLRWWVLVADC